MISNTFENSIPAQILYFSHGGGPLPLVNDPSHEAMNTFMRELPNQLHRPECIIVFSAHWEEKVVTLQGNATPKLLFDYYGFPDETYHLKYPAVNSLSLVEDITQLFTKANIPFALHQERGYDHGVFIPLMMMYPTADIPILQISLLSSLDSNEHILLGKALRPLLDRNILFIGSGFSFHNLRAFRFNSNKEEDPLNDAFQDFLKSSLCSDISEKDRNNQLIYWEDAPNARYCHPREEHLLPLHICYGLAGNRAQCIFDDDIAGKRALAFLWRKKNQHR